MSSSGVVVFVLLVFFVGLPFFVVAMATVVFIVFVGWNKTLFLLPLSLNTIGGLLKVFLEDLSFPPFFFGFFGSICGILFLSVFG